MSQFDNAAVSAHLSHVRIVMVNTTLPANIGSALRAMKTMGLSKLVLVAPKTYPHPDINALAAGAVDLIEQIEIVATLEDAIKDCHLVFGTSARSRTIPWPLLDARPAAEKSMQAVVQNQQEIAVVFGREDRGLTNEELAYADYHVQIDANPAYPVLNVASAVQVIASFIYAYAQTHIQADSEVNDIAQVTDNLETLEQGMLNTYVRQQWDEPAITQQQLQQLTERITALMVQRKLADSENLKSLPSRLSRLGSRIQLDQKEYQLLSALLAKLLKD